MNEREIQAGRQAYAHEMLKRFLQAQPQWLEQDVKYIRLSGCDEPQPMLSERANMAFVEWLMRESSPQQIAQAKNIMREMYRAAKEDA
jgi:hypothetical protein